ncbi:Two-component system YycFG regulatory protein [Bacillus sp. THAF10]|uniref:two-component system regulatory protein YycI n=1 Tax=Bacillus sp. THAF10 TaxID=2587848 RepID=UPI001267E547|nr:two-component system regulatory protein YycI [Bacillus sp. THAF10]QFT91175.1 Two-component system YycFG regulatory protein [Bacillus sp. THAF10]
MDWRKTKTIFIITFLILNIFLGARIIEKRDRSHLELLAESSLEEQFQIDEITYAELPKTPSKQSYISGNSYIFSDEDVATLQDKGQTVERVEETKLLASLEEPLKLPESNTNQRLNTIFQDQVLFAEDYSFWGLDPQDNTLTFFQKYDGKDIFRNSNGMVKLYLNELKEITSYEQTFITNLEKMDVEQDVIPVIDTLENLYKRGDLRPRSHVGHMELGYFTLLDSTNSHVLIPTWHIVINDNQDIFVNAFEGSTIRKETRTLE